MTRNQTVDFPDRLPDLATAAVSSKPPTMAEKGVKVFGMWASPMAIRVKGVQYEDLANRSEAQLRCNLMLVHDGSPMAEPAIIVGYIDKTWKDGYSFMPADPYERAQARFWSRTRFADEKVRAHTCSSCECATK
jgi:glutathione S-transferase